MLSDFCRWRIYGDFHVNLNKLTLNFGKLRFFYPLLLVLFPSFVIDAFFPRFGLLAPFTSLKAADVCACVQMLCVYRSQSHPFTQNSPSPVNIYRGVSSRRPRTESLGRQEAPMGERASQHPGRQIMEERKSQMSHKPADGLRFTAVPTLCL